MFSLICCRLDTRFNGRDETQDKSDLLYTDCLFVRREIVQKLEYGVFRLVNFLYLLNNDFRWKIN